jgi:hypothetical protein
MPFPEPDPDAAREHDAAGPVVRPYTVTAGRTRPSRGRFNLISIIAATRPLPALGPERGPEQVAILRMCQRPLSVAEVAARLDLPLSVVRVLLGDLLDEALIAVRQPQPADQRLSDETLEAMIDGLRAL